MSDREALETLVEKFVRSNPGQTARQIAAALDADKSTINSILYSRRDLFTRSSDSAPKWYVVSATQPADEGRDLGVPSMRGDLYPWQEDALRAWQQNDCKGVIEAVTGSGKTRVGLAAAQRHVAGGGKVAVIVHTQVLLEQWDALLREAMPGARIGHMGAGMADTLESADVLIAIAASAYRYQLGLPQGSEGLLLADECHHYTGGKWRDVLEDDFGARLGLTATYEVPDGGDLEVLDRYFGGVVYRYGYAEAVSQGVVAPFRVGLLAVPFTTSEQDEYNEMTRSLRAARKKLIALGAPREPYSKFIQFVNQAKDSGTREEGIAASRYWKASTDRRDLLATAEAKSRAVEWLARCMESANRSIVFTQTISSAKEAASVLTDQGVRAAAVHSDLVSDDRDALLRLFAAGALDAVVAPRILDEGIDIPEADLGVILAASRRRRQMIQRMGRVIRRKDDGRAARFVIVFVEGTSEDPASDAHDAFLEEVLDVAEKTQTFRLGEDDQEIHDFLAT